VVILSFLARDGQGRPPRDASGLGHDFAFSLIGWLCRSWSRPPPPWPQRALLQLRCAVDSLFHSDDKEDGCDQHCGHCRFIATIFSRANDSRCAPALFRFPLSPPFHTTPQARAAGNPPDAVEAVQLSRSRQRQVSGHDRDIRARNLTNNGRAQRESCRFREWSSVCRPPMKPRNAQRRRREG
jgi:hypothetical protein